MANIDLKEEPQSFRINIFSNIYRVFKKTEATWVPILFTLLVPLAIGLLVGTEFSANSVNAVPTAIVDQDNSQLSRDLTEKIRTNDIFNVTNYTPSIDELQNLIEGGKVATGVIIPPHFASDMMSGKAPKIMILYDGAQMSMTGAAKGKIAETLSTIKSGYLMQVLMGNFKLTQEQAIKYMQPIQYTTRVLGNPEKSNPVFMLQGLLLNFTQIAVFILGGELVRKNEKNLKNLWKHGLFAGYIGSIAVLLCICSQILIFDAPFRGSIPAAAVMTVIYMTMMGNFGVACMVKKDDRLEVAKSASSVALMLMVCGYTFPVIAMPGFLQVIAKILPFTYYASPMRDISLLGSSFKLMVPNIACLIAFLLLSWAYVAMTLRGSHRVKKAKKHPVARMEDRIVNEEQEAAF